MSNKHIPTRNKGSEKRVWVYSKSRQQMYNLKTREWSNDLKRFKPYLTGVIE